MKQMIYIYKMLSLLTENIECSLLDGYQMTGVSRHLLNQFEIFMSMLIFDKYLTSTIEKGRTFFISIA